jgi:hypothetical protein
LEINLNLDLKKKQLGYIIRVKELTPMLDGYHKKEWVPDNSYMPFFVGENR